METVDKLREIVKSAEKKPIDDPVKLAYNVQAYSSVLKDELDIIEAPYGRFLVAQNSNITVQVHLHSPKYEGQIHDHGTWGIMIALKGSFKLEDWMISEQLGNKVIRNYVMPESGLVTFPFIKGLDWHKNTNMDLFRAMSLHIYGPGYNNDMGTSYDPSRGEFTTRARMEMPFL